MAIRVQRHANVSKQATLLDGLDVSPLKWRVCGCGLNQFFLEGMNHISNVEVHLNTRRGNVNNARCIPHTDNHQKSSLDIYYSQCPAKSTSWHVRPSKTQIRLSNESKKYVFIKKVYK